MDLSTNKKQPRSSTPNPEVTVTKKHCTPSPIRCEARQREQNADLAALDFSDSSIESYVKMHHYLSVCNCPICIKNSLNRKLLQETRQNVNAQYAALTGFMREDIYPICITALSKSNI